MKHEKQLKRALRRLKTPDMHTVLPHIAPAEARATQHKRRTWLTAPMAVAMAILLTVGVAAAGGVIISRINADMITESNIRLAEPPEGYTAIYTAADLMQMRRDIEAGTNATHYILMNDITFTEADFAEGGLCPGGWEPLDLTSVKYYHFDDRDSIPEGYEAGKAYGTPYVKAIRKNKLKVFNGNGHVIRGLDIRADVADMIAAHTAYDYTCPNVYVGLFGSTYSYTFIHIINLGMEDTRITVTGVDIHAPTTHTVHVGAIAGEVYYAGACYAQNTDIRVDLSTAKTSECIYCDKGIGHGYELAIGSLVGTATYLDACYAEDYTVDVTCNGQIPVYPHIHGLAGMSQSTLTSWHTGTVSLKGNAIAESCQLAEEHFDPWTYGDRVPVALNMENFEILNAKAIAAHGEDSYGHRLIKAYYMLKDPAKLTSARQIEELNAVMRIWDKMIAHHTGDYETKYDAYYLLDHTITGEQEIAQMEERIRAVFDSDEEYRAFCDACNIKIGDIYCYELPADTTSKPGDLEGFDFETVWIMQNGKPRLRIFAQ